MGRESIEILILTAFFFDTLQIFDITKPWSELLPEKVRTSMWNSLMSLMMRVNPVMMKCSEAGKDMHLHLKREKIMTVLKMVLQKSPRRVFQGELFTEKTAKKTSLMQVKWMMKVTVTLMRRSLRRKHQPREKVLQKKVKRERKEPRKGSQQVERKARSPSMHHLLRRNQRRRRNQKVILKLKK